MNEIYLEERESVFGQMQYIKTDMGNVSIDSRKRKQEVLKHAQPDIYQKTLKKKMHSKQKHLCCQKRHIRA